MTFAGRCLHCVNGRARSFPRPSPTTSNLITRFGNRRTGKRFSSEHRLRPGNTHWLTGSRGSQKASGSRAGLLEQ